jgi:rhamnosyltransferase
VTEEMVVGVIVTYYPSVGPLSDLLSALQPQVDSVVVVDNGSPESFKVWLSERVDTSVQGVFLDENRGIAAAQNVGVRWARERYASHVLLLDQDSLPASDMVARLLDAAGRMAARGHKVAAVGPRFLDERRQNPPPFTQVRGVRVRRQNCDDASSVVPVDCLIASGCLIPTPVLDVVGMMQEDLFIDYVDIEWGLRAKQHGFESFGVCAAQMGHDLGDEPIRFVGRAFPARSPLRHYYILRNAVWLYGHASFPLNWKLADGWRLLLKYVFYSLFARPRLTHLRMMTLGIWDGLNSRLGRLDTK